MTAKQFNARHGLSVGSPAVDVIDSSGNLLGLDSQQIANALGFTPYNATNPSSYITASSLTPYLTSAIAASTYQPIGPYLTGITSGQVTTALGFTPYNATNPSGYITGSDNAATAATLETARTINGVSFNGSANITVADDTKLPLSGGTMTGAIAFAAGQTFPGAGDVTLAGTQTLTNKTIQGGVYTNIIDQTGSVRGGVVVVNELDIECSAGNYFTKTISANSTFTFSNAPVSRAYSFTLELTHTSGSVTWPPSVQWPGGSAPTLTAGKTHLFMFVTDDGGSRWCGAGLADYTT